VLDVGAGQGVRHVQDSTGADALALLSAFVRFW
jgi:hypothetical protein